MAAAPRRGWESECQQAQAREGLRTKVSLSAGEVRAESPVSSCCSQPGANQRGDSACLAIWGEKRKKEKKRERERRRRTEGRKEGRGRKGKKNTAFDHNSNRY